MILVLVISSLLAFAQAQQFASDCWLPAESGVILCFAGSDFHDGALLAYHQCRYLAQAGYGYGSGYGSSYGYGYGYGSGSGYGYGSGSGSGSGSGYGQYCPPVANLAVNHPNPMYHETALSDCILTSMDFVAPDGGLRHKEIKKGLGSLLNHTVLDNFYHGNNASEKR